MKKISRRSFITAMAAVSAAGAAAVKALPVQIVLAAAFSAAAAEAQLLASALAFLFADRPT